MLILTYFGAIALKSSTISSMDIRRELNWLPVYYRISYSLLTWKALYTAEPSYLSELISVQQCEVLSRWVG